MIRIRSKREGFWRCGIAHHADWTEHPDGRFTPAELERLQNEPMLQVDIVADSAVAPDGAVADKPETEPACVPPSGTTAGKPEKPKRKPRADG